MPIKNNVYGQVFMFGCANHSGFSYGHTIAKVILGALGQVNYSGGLEYYAANVPAWSEDWAVGIVFEKEYDYELWKLAKDYIAINLPNDILFHGMESSSKNGMANDLMFIGSLKFADGKPVDSFRGSESSFFRSILDES